MKFVSTQSIISHLKSERFLNLASPIVELTMQVRQAFQFSKNPQILYVSGGVDSQAMLEIFARAAVPARVVTLSLESNNICFNDFDVSIAIKLAEKYGFSHEVRKLDPLDFFISGKYREFMSKYGLTTPGVALYAHLLESTPASHCCLMAGQPPYPNIPSHGEPEILIKGEDSFFHNRVLLANKINGHGNFLCGTPRIVASWLQLPYFQKTLRKLQPLETEEVFKRNLYDEAGFMPGLQIHSHHGLENFIPYFCEKTGSSWSDI